MSDKAKNILGCYLALCFIAAFIVSYAFLTTRVIDYIPGLAVLVLYLFILKKPIIKEGDLGLSLAGMRYWILAPLFVTALCILSYGITILLHPDLLKSKEAIIRSLEESGLYTGHITVSLLAIALINAILGSLVSIPASLGQELGWRALMQPLLFKVLKPFPAFLLGGMLWGLWSFFFSGSGFSSTESILNQGLLTILFCIPVGVILQYFYFKTRSIIVAALAHAAIFKSMETASQVLIDTEQSLPLCGLMGIPGLAIFWAVALLLMIKINWILKNTYHENTK